MKIYHAIVMSTSLYILCALQLQAMNNSTMLAGSLKGITNNLIESNQTASLAFAGKIKMIVHDRWLKDEEKIALIKFTLQQEIYAASK